MKPVRGQRGLALALALGVEALSLSGLRPGGAGCDTSCVARDLCVAGRLRLRRRVGGPLNIAFGHETDFNHLQCW